MPTASSRRARRIIRVAGKAARAARGGSPDDEEAMNFEITPQELQERRQRQEQLVLIDVREVWERQTASIEPSDHIPMNDIPARLQELDPERHIVVYCHHGARSLSVTGWLRQQGFERVQSMAGGIDRWSKQIDPAVPRY
jgi:rhodanese-related sulfurtransferase